MYSAPRISAPFQHLLQRSRLSGNTILKFLMALGLSLHCTAQVVDPITAAQAPIAGAGHHYIGMGSETVNPADGSVTFSLPIQTPTGRQLNFPFSIRYGESSPSTW